jgi:nitrite reductase (NADH) large subunit
VIALTEIKPVAAAAAGTTSPSRKRARATGTLVIVGNGMVSYKLCARLMELPGGGRLRIVVFGEEQRPAYDRVHLTQFFTGRTPDQLELAPRAWYEENGIELHLGDPVTTIDRERQIVRSAAGREVKYDQLVLATGSRAFVPPIPGHDLPGIFVYRTLDDLARIREYAASGGRAAVLGGGLLGLEAAKALHDLGLPTWIVERGSSLLARQLASEGGGLLRAHVEKLGLHVCVQREAEKIERLPRRDNADGSENNATPVAIPSPLKGERGSVRRENVAAHSTNTENPHLTPALSPPSEGAERETASATRTVTDDLLLQFNTGECLRVKLVVLAAGIRPRDELGAQCGLDIAPRGGVRVNDSLQTSDPNIFAIGECASHNGVVYGLAAPGYKMADLLADNLVGKRRKFTGSDQSTRLKLAGIEVSTLGDFQADGQSVRWHGKEGYRELMLQQGRLVGATAVGEWSEASRAHELIERRARVWSWQRRRFLQTGKIWKGEAAQHVSLWPEAALICNCTGVRRGALTAACNAGCNTVEQLAARTGASTICGSCKPLLAALVDAPISLVRQSGLKTLAVACVLAFALALTILLAQPIPFADSVQAGLRKLDVLWRDAFWKQATGFTLLGLALISLLMSLRKRIKRFTWGEFGHWRAVHAVLGAITLLALVSHTGFRLGHNFNLILMTNFLALAGVGALAGAVTALERRLQPVAAKRLRAFWTGTHIALVWPLPVLVVFHVLMAYYF